MRGDGGGNYELAFNLDGIVLSLSVSAVRDPVLHYKGTNLKSPPHTLKTVLRLAYQSVYPPSMIKSWPVA